MVNSKSASATALDYLVAKAPAGRNAPSQHARCHRSMITRTRFLVNI